MRIGTVLSICGAMAGAATCQTSEPTLQRTIEKYVFGGDSEGWGIKQMRRAGDSTAVALTKVLSGRILDREQTGSAVEVLEAAFSVPSLIELQSDRKPSTALFVLRCLDLYVYRKMVAT